jgi:putative transposase
MLPPVLHALLAYSVALLRTRCAMQLEILALRHQLAVSQRSVPRPRLQPTDRLLWVWLAGLWSGWRVALAFVQPRTITAWHRQRFRDHWRHLSPHSKPGRPTIAKELRNLIQDMSRANPTGGAPRMVGELRKRSIHVAQSTVEKSRVHPRKPPSPTWKAFLKNHVQALVSLDFFVTPTLTHKVLFVLVILAHERRRVMHLNVIEHPTVEWTAQQVVEAFPRDKAPRYLRRDRDSIYGASFRQQVRHMGIEEALMAPRSPWQNPSVARLIGSIRRECLDHVLVLNERHLRWLLTEYFQYEHRWRTPLSLAMDGPEPRPVQPPEPGRVIAVPEVGGWHHHDARRVASVGMHVRGEGVTATGMRSRV